MPRLKREDFRARPPELRRGSKGRTQSKSTNLESCRTHDIRNTYTNVLRGGCRGVIFDDIFACRCMSLVCFARPSGLPSEYYI